MNMEQQLWEYIDGLSSEEEREFIQKKLAIDAEWQTKYAELIRIHELLSNEDLEVPSLRFSKNVMDQIAKLQVTPAAADYINKNVFRGIFSFFLIMILGLLIYCVAQFKWSTTTSDNFLPSFNGQLNKLNWTWILNNSYVNIFIGISAILALILTDKYLQSRKKQSVTGH